MTRYRRHPATVSTEIGDGAVALHLATDLYYTLNATAACAWRRLEAEASADAVAEEWVREFEVGPEEARLRAEELLRLLVEHGLVVEAAG